MQFCCPNKIVAAEMAVSFNDSSLTLDQSILAPNHNEMGLARCAQEGKSCDSAVVKLAQISHSDECPCNTGPQTPNHILQSCPTFDALRGQTWPSRWRPTESFGDRLRHCGRLRTLSYSPDWRSSMAGNAEEEKESGARGRHHTQATEAVGLGVV